MVRGIQSLLHSNEDPMGKVSHQTWILCDNFKNWKETGLRLHFSFIAKPMKIVVLFYEVK